MKKRYVLIAVVLIASPLALLAWPIEDPFFKRVWGPYRCDACRVESPIADAGTLAYINRQEASKKRSHRSVRGEKYIICSATVCTVYEKTSSEDWLGVQQDAIAPAPPRAGRADRTGRRGGGGGAVGVGGTGGGGKTGTVTVGDYKRTNQN